MKVPVNQEMTVLLSLLQAEGGRNSEENSEQPEELEFFPDNVHYEG